MSDGVKTVFICRKCGQVAYAVNSCFCSKCKLDMAPSAYDLAQWAKLTPENQSSVVHAMIDPGLQDAASASDHSTSVAAPASVWVKLLRGVAYFFLAVEIIASLAAGIILIGNDQPLFGLLVLAAGILFSLISVAGIMVYLGIAADLSAVRNMLEQK